MTTPAPAAPGYRLLFYAALTVALVVTALWLGTPPPAAAPAFEGLHFWPKRDAEFDFVVTTPYGYSYAGRSGNVIDECVLKYGAFEKDELFLMGDWLRAERGAGGPVTAVDVGANSGNHTLFLSRHCDKVIAVEPFPPVVRKMRRNLELSPKVTNVEILEVGFGDAEAELPFAAPPEDNDGGGTFLSKTRPATETLRVVVGDAALAGKVAGRVALLKVDVEGFEAGVLRGLAKTLARDRPLAVVEVTAPPGGSIATQAELLALLPADYELRFFRKSWRGWADGSRVVDPADPAAFGRGQLEVLALPREKAGRLPAGAS